MTSFSRSNFLNACAIALVLCVPIGCKRDEMANQPKARTYRETEFFADGTSARPLVPGTIPRGQTAVVSDRFAPDLPATGQQDYPFPITYAELKRGQERFDIYCAVCHGRTGVGDGMIVQRGFTRPPAFFPVPEHQIDSPDLYARERALLDASPGRIVNVITNGFGAMYSYATRVPLDDRWRIAAYVKTLQLSRSVKFADLPATDRDLALRVPGTQPSTQPAPGSMGGTPQ